MLVASFPKQQWVCRNVPSEWSVPSGNQLSRSPTEPNYWPGGSLWINNSATDQQTLLIHEVAHSLFIPGSNASAMVEDTGTPNAYTIADYCKP